MGSAVVLPNRQTSAFIYNKFYCISGLHHTFGHSAYVSDFAAQLCDTISRVAGLPAVITDRDSVIAAGGVPRREVVDKRVSPQVEQVMEDRRSVQADQPLSLCDGTDKYRVLIAVPILSEGDVLGCVAFVSDGDAPALGEVELKLAQTVAGFLGRHMES